ncbi:hypothetical protein BDD12DRAFT_917690 [Trichophaea hybrida]|nr:hypothetical protein BDD12DRAFT_917690 [Trichophaea hybrida]
MQSDRSIYIGFDPSTESQDNTSSSATQNAPVQGYNQQRRPVANTPLLSSRRAAPSYYPQPTMQVSPIPEESSLSRHESYASSAAIPTNWGPDEFYSSSSSHSDNRRPIEGQGEHGLVRQASVGRKTRPLLTEIKGVDRSKSRRGSASAESDLSPSTSPVRSQIASPVLQPPIPRNQSDKKQPSVTAKELGISAGEDVVLGSTQRTSTMGGTQSASIMGGQRASTSSRIPGRRLPPRLNMDAVRDAEARGSLTSLPDLIRRATKLAAVLETGRPGSSMNWGRRNSMLGPNGRGLRGDTNSISDMLAAFPPPASRDATSRTMSRWFLPDDYDHGGDNGDVKQLRNRRRICGLPLWAFIIMVILGLVLITAAVVVPLQLVSMSKASNNDSYVTRCKKSNPCQNGGENIATSDFCGCVCTNGFTGSSCTIKEADTSCTSFNFKDRQSSSGVIAGIKNATIGSALPRLFDKGNNTYHIELDLSLLLGVFSKGNLSCTLQNALVNFTGKTQPDVQSQSRFRREVIVDRRRQLDTDPSGSSIITDPAASPTPTGSGASATPTGSQKKNLNQDAIDFARVAVLYLAQTESLRTAEEAHQNLDTTFRGGTDSGNVTSSGVTFELDKKSIVLRNGSIVGGET